MNRSEHLQWCKDRALKYLETNDNTEAYASFLSDMSKHVGTSRHKALEIGAILMFSGALNRPDQMKQWIEGFN